MTSTTTTPSTSMGFKAKAAVVLALFIGLFFVEYPLIFTLGYWSWGGLIHKTITGVLIALVEFDPVLAEIGLFGRSGLGLPIRRQDLDTAALQLPDPEQAGHQRFFSLRGRAFCLYVVRRAGDSGDHEAGRRLAELAALLASLRVAPAGGSG